MSAKGSGARVKGTMSAGGVTDHGALAGLADDDHPQYFLVDGSRAVTGTVLPMSAAAPVLAATGSNAAMTVKGNLDASDSGTDVVAASSVSRSAGDIFAVKNLSTTRFRVYATGDCYVTGKIRTLGAQLTLRGAQGAASAASDVLVDSDYARTAGAVLEVKNNSTRLTRTMWDGRFISMVPATAVADGDLDNGSFSAYLDAGENNLTWKVKTSGGTVKTGSVAIA